MQTATMAGLIRIDLPEKTLLLCDGAFVIWGSDIYRSTDDDFGAIGSVETPEEGVGDELPAMRMTFLPKSTAAAVDLAQPEFQGCRVRMWIAEVDEATAEVIGTPTLMFDGQVDAAELVIDRGSRALEMDIVPAAERLFLIDEGNTLSPRFHKLLFPGELGEDNATGVGVGVAWGTASASGSYGYGYGGYGAPGGGDSRNFYRNNQ